MTRPICRPSLRRSSDMILIWFRKWCRLACDRRAERALVPAFVYFFQLLYPFAWVNDPLEGNGRRGGRNDSDPSPGPAAHRRGGVCKRGADRRCRTGGGGEKGRTHLAGAYRSGLVGAPVPVVRRYLADDRADRVRAAALLGAAAGGQHGGDGPDLAGASGGGAFSAMARRSGAAWWPGSCCPGHMSRRCAGSADRCFGRRSCR